VANGGGGKDGPMVGMAETIDEGMDCCCPGKWLK